MYVAQRADKERESVIRQLGAPVDGVKEKLGEMENTLEGFQRTMHLVLSEVDADRERSATMAVRTKCFGGCFAFAVRCSGKEVLLHSLLSPPPYKMFLPCHQQHPALGFLPIN